MRLPELRARAGRLSCEVATQAPYDLGQHARGHDAAAAGFPAIRHHQRQMSSAGSSWTRAEPWSLRGLRVACADCSALASAVPSARGTRIRARTGRLLTSSISMAGAASLASLPEAFRDAFFGGLDYAIIGKKL